MLTSNSNIDSGLINFSSLKKVFAFLSVAFLGLVEVQASAVWEGCKNAIHANQNNAEVICLDILSKNANDLTPGQRTFIHLDLSGLAASKGQFEKADEYLMQTLAENPRLTTVSRLRYNWLRKKGFNQYKQDNFEAALPFMNEALDIAYELELDSSIATSLNDIGATYMELGRYEKALENFENSLEHLSRVKRLYSLALTLNNLGIIYKSLNQGDRALVYFTRAIYQMNEHLRLKPSDSFALRELANFYEEKGSTYLQMNRFAEAQADLNEALNLYQEHNFSTEQIRVYAALAKLAISNNELDKAEKAVARGQSIELEKEWQSLELSAALVDLYTAQENDVEAINEALIGKALADEKGRFQFQLKFLRQLGELYKRQQDYPTSQRYLNQYIALYEDFLQQKFSPQIADLQSVIEVQQQQKDMQALEFQQKTDKAKIVEQRIGLLLASTIILLLIGIFYISHTKKQREKAFLQREINFHKTELARLNEEANNEEGPSDQEISDQKIDDQKINGKLSITDVDKHESNSNGAGNKRLEEEDAIDQDAQFRICVVSLMQDCVNVWGTATGNTNIELAEQSKIWTVVIDEGRLRTRTLERYLDINKLPKSPRWRQVVRTCRYILINCELTTLQRDKLNNDLERLLELQKQQALSVTIQT